ncbi:MAG: IS1595 family transposase [Candidatus Scalindua sp.]
MVKKIEKPEINLVELIDQYHSEDECRTLLEELRWPDGVVCPRCSSKSISKIQDRYQYDCNSCRYQFSVKAGTIFHDSHLPLWKWFLTIYMMVESKKGISANQIKRTIGVSYKTAWYLCHRIRKAMTEMRPEHLRGTVEVDETWIGGKHKGPRGRGAKGKTIVVGAVERNGKVRLEVIEKANRKNLHGFIKEYTAPDTETIVTDEWSAYRGKQDHDTEHKTVNHGTKQWVNGDAHTNTIENVWSLLKRSIMGSYHKIDPKHLNSYLDELEWRYNNRENPFLFRDTLKKLIESENLEYQKLIAS